MPPSPVVITFRGCSEKHASGLERADRAGPCSVAPIAHAASSTMATPWRSAELEERVHVGRQADLVDGHDRLRPRA